MNMFTHGRLNHFMAEAPEGGDPSTAAPAAPTPTGSVLDSGAQPDYFPEKYQVKKEDGSLDLEQSSRKLAESYKHLETRLGSGDIPPKTADEYAVKLEGVEGFNWDEFKADEGTQSFLNGAHAKGLTNAQVEYVIGEYMKAAPGLVEGGVQLSQQDCAATLKAAWGDEQAMTQNVRASYRAAETFASEPGKLGTSPRSRPSMATTRTSLRSPPTSAANSRRTTPSTAAPRSTKLTSTSKPLNCAPSSRLCPRTIPSAQASRPSSMRCTSRSTASRRPASNSPRQIVGKPTPPTHEHRRHPSNGPACDGTQTPGKPRGAAKPMHAR